MLVFGRNVAKEILKSDKKVEKIIIQEDFNDDSVISLIEKRGIRPQTMSKRDFSRFDKYSHQGIILYIEDFKYCEIEDFMYENPDQIAYAFGYIEDDLYYTQDEANLYKGTSTEHSKYKDCTFDSKDKLIKHIKDNAKAGATIELLATYENFDSDDVIEALNETDVQELGSSVIICGYVWFEIVK